MQRVITVKTVNITKNFIDFFKGIIRNNTREIINKIMKIIISIMIWLICMINLIDY